MAREKTYSAKLTYAEMELLGIATHSGMAEARLDDDAPEESARAAAIRRKISDVLNSIDAR